MNREREKDVICPLGKPVRVKIPVYALLGKGDYKKMHHCIKDRDNDLPSCSYFNECLSQFFKISVKNGKIEISKR